VPVQPGGRAIAAGHTRPTRVFGRDDVDATVVVLHSDKRDVDTDEVATVRPVSIGTARLRDGLIVHISRASAKPRSGTGRDWAYSKTSCRCALREASSSEKPLRKRDSA